MIDYSNAQIDEVVIHIVGNKSKDEQLILADQVATISDDVTKQYVKNIFSLHLISRYATSLHMKRILALTNYILIVLIFLITQSL